MYCKWTKSARFHRDSMMRWSNEQSQSAADAAALQQGKKKKQNLIGTSEIAEKKEGKKIVIKPRIGIRRVMMRNIYIYFVLLQIAFVLHAAALKSTQSWRFSGVSKHSVRPNKLQPHVYPTSTLQLMKNDDVTQADSPLHDRLKSQSLTFAINSYLALQPIATHAADSNVATFVVLRPALDALVSIMSLLFLFRTVLSWYPKTDLTRFPYNAVVWPTEPLLVPMRSLIPPAFGVDISSIVWIMILSFVREVFTGQQGILTLLERGATSM